MILYLCSNQNINLFDFLEKERRIPIKKMSGLFRLKQFVIHDVRKREEIRQKDKTDFAFLCRDVKIAVVGAAHKVGTTTTAFNLVNFLVNNGADAAYVEANTNGHLAKKFIIFRHQKGGWIFG